MKVDTRALALAGGLTWGGAIFGVTLAHLLWPGYGQPFLDALASVYPGFRPNFGVESVIVGTVYALVDGLIGGAAFGWLYNWITRPAR